MEFTPKYKTRLAKRGLLFGDESAADQLESPRLMPLDDSPLRQAMSAQTNTDQIQPKADPENLDSAGATRPSLFKPTTKQKWLGYDEPTSADEYGLEKPAKHHEGYLSKIAGIGLPALIGLAGGVGLAPGLLTGFLGERGREAAINKAEAKDYNTARASAFQSDKLQKELDLKTAGQEETAKHHRAIERLKGAGLGTKMDEKKALDIETKYRQGLPTSNEERAFLKAYYRLKNTRAAENPMESVE